MKSLLIFLFSSVMLGNYLTNGIRYLSATETTSLSRVFAKKLENDLFQEVRDYGENNIKTQELMHFSDI